MKGRMSDEKKPRRRAAPPTVESRRVLHDVDSLADMTPRERDAVPPLDSPEFDTWNVAAVLEHNRERIENSGVGVLQALNLCLASRVDPPPWLAQLVLNRLEAFLQFETATLDQAFDVQRITEKTRAAIVDRKRLIWQVSDAIMATLKADPSWEIGQALFEEVGMTLGIGASKCQELYREGVERYGTPDPKDFKRQLRRSIG